MKRLFVPLFAIFLFASQASAHGLATSNTQISGKYLVEFEYNTPGRIIAGQYENYNFDILDANSKQFINFDKAFVRFSKKGGDVVEVSDISPTETLGAGMPSARLGTIFSEAGDYTLELTFYDASGSALASTNFDFTVDPGSKPILQSNSQSLVLEISLVVGGIILGFALSKLRTRAH